MNPKQLLLLCLLLTPLLYAQNDLNALLKQYNDESVPYISAQELAMPKTKAVILDVRAQKEYDTSHIKNAIFIDYEYFNINQVRHLIPNKNQMIVVYCSLGIRSETIAKQLQADQYTNVHNLYGGIFEWKNKGFQVYDAHNKPTENVHVFSKEWSRWLTKGQKVYE
ncbi:MAG: rhodanese-like domain-containing protein [Flavobacteriaceae bacterium]|nr:rhodanese-like domain-containing protein [Flavobacteriaceae bacterium]